MVYGYAHFTLEISPESHAEMVTFIREAIARADAASDERAARDAERRARDHYALELAADEWIDRGGES